MQNPNREMELVFDQIKEELDISDQNIEKRVFILKQELTKRFGLQIATRFSISFVKETFKPAIIGYLLNQPAIVYVQIHAILERAAILLLPELIFGIHTNVAKERSAIERLLNRKTLSDLTPIIIDLGVWEKEDEKIVNNLIKKRNGIAHHNPVEIAKHFNSGKYLNAARIHETVQRDKKSHIAIVDSISLIHKLVSK